MTGAPYAFRVPDESPCTPDLTDDLMVSASLVRVDKFFKDNYGKTLLGVGAVVFLVGVSYAVNWFTHKGDRLAQVVRANALVSGRLRELETATRMDAGLRRAAAALVEATNFYSEHLKGATSLAQLSPELVEQGRSVAENARGEVAYALGILDGTSFLDEGLAKIAVGFRQQLG